MRCVDKDIISFSESNVILTKMIEKGYMSPVNNLEEISLYLKMGDAGLIEKKRTQAASPLRTGISSPQYLRPARHVR